jgi:hypothetical protein
MQGSNLLGSFWESVLQSKWQETRDMVQQLQSKKFQIKRKPGGGRKKTHEKFPTIVEHVKKFISQHSTTTHERRREDVEEIDTSEDFGLGFRLVDLLHYLYTEVEGLYEHGFGIRSCHCLLAPPNRNHRSSVRVRYHSVTNVKIGRRTNNKREITEGVHFARAERKISYEFFARYGQVNMSGDDMNIIQVGSPAVSRYHQIKGFFPPGEAPNFTVHDFPNSEYGIKMGGFMIMGGENLHDEQQKVLPDPGF